MRILKQSLAVLLVVCMLIGMVPATAFATESTPADDETIVDTIVESKTTEEVEFIRAFSLDCGRIYFTVDQIKAIIDLLEENNYTHLALAFGNSGFRFLLDDMAIGSYSSDAVKEAILAGNTYYTTHDGHNANDGTNSSNPANTCLSQSEMDTIISYANSQGISIIPVLNSPGHMNTIVYAMDQLDISDAGYPVSSSYNSESTINIDNTTVTAFTDALIQKYITYFAGKGCAMFNLGADEFANDPTDDTKLTYGFASMSTDLKATFISYVNNVASMISDAGMTPMMFNDGYAWSDASFNKDIVICYWTTGAVSSTAIANAGHKVINTNQNWYYVLGEPFGTDSSSWCSYAKAYNGVSNIPVTTMVDGGSVGDNLIGAMMCFWCDYTDEVYTTDATQAVALADTQSETVTESAKVATLISTLSAKNPTYFVAASDDTVDSDSSTSNDRTITVVVGQTATDTIENVSVSGDCETGDSTIATATAETYQMEASKKLVPITSLSDIVSGGQYLIAEKDGTTLTANSGSWYDNGNLLALSGTATVDNTNVWTITANGDYYTISSGTDSFLTFDTNSASVSSTATNITLTYIDGYWRLQANGDYLNDFGDAEQAAGGWYEYDQNANWLIYPLAETEAGTGTRVTFTGHTIGTTYATIGGVNYTINVVEEDISDVTLTYHPWISSFPVYEEDYSGSKANGGNANPQTIAATATGVYSADGAAFADLVWATGDWEWEGSETDDVQTVYWKGTVLPEGSHQEGNSQTDSSMSGTDFTYIRYWNGEWSYSSDRVTWTAVKDTDEVCAYYLQKTAVTQEVTTYVKDWAHLPSNANVNDSNSQKALSFAVVYPDGTMNPAEDSIYGTSTLIYYANLANLGFIRIGVTDYAVSKITYTFGERASTPEEYWTENETINWEKTTVGEVTWYDETTCWDKSYGTEPVVNGEDLADEINATTWAENDAVLILIYLEPVVTEDSLTVIYYDEKFDDTLYSYNVIVETGHNFTEHIGRVVTVDGVETIDTTQKPGAFATDAARIDVTGFGIVNNLDVAQKFQTDLTKVPDAIGKYNSGLYTYTGSKISTDGRTLYLYYNIDTEALSPNYVVDFGLPLTFELSEVVKKGLDTVKSVTVNEKTRYGTLAYDDETQVFTYTPTTILQNIDVLSINILFDGESAATTTNVGVTPATTVYYEESFINWDSNWSGGNENITIDNQTAEVLGQGSNNFGYDQAYATQTGASNGTNATTSTIGAKASFTFTGNGIQIFANSTEGSGYVAVEVKDSSGAVVKMIMVDTVVDPGTTDATTGQTGDLYGLPIVSLVDLQNMEHGTYTVTLTKIMDTEPVYIDGIRVFNTMIDSSIFVDDLEDNPDFYELRDMVLYALSINDATSEDYGTVAEMAGQVYDEVIAKNAANATSDSVVAVITDNNITSIYDDENEATAEATPQDLLDNGPKNELYLYKNQTLTFKVKTSRLMQIGLKAPAGATKYTITIDGTTTVDSVDLISSVDMFYSLNTATSTDHTYTITITNNGSNILSITLLKICDDPNASFEALTADDIETALRAMGYTDSESEEESTEETTTEVEETEESTETPESTEAETTVETTEEVTTEESASTETEEPETTPESTEAEETEIVPESTEAEETEESTGNPLQNIINQIMGWLGSLFNSWKSSTPTWSWRR